jgi:4-diphosphocytidyl-2-C-methyl-D-erythritol kinase
VSGQPDGHLPDGHLTEVAPAKVNLHLHVTGRRDDGYHLLDSLVVFAGIGDRISVQPAASLSLRIIGPFAAGLAEEPDNLVLRAARSLAEQCGITPHGALTLEKNLPVSSGIGGGSADAAAALRLLCRFWSVNPEPAALADLGNRLGADIPVCLLGRPAVMSGTGAVLNPVEGLAPLGIVLINPGVAVATAAVFRTRSAAFSSPLPLDSKGCANGDTLIATLRRATNDLEPPALALAPEIGDVLGQLRAEPGCLLARMSGSGATCFGLFASPFDAADAASHLGRSGWWVWGGGFHDPRRF